VNFYLDSCKSDQNHLMVYCKASHWASVKKVSKRGDLRKVTQYILTMTGQSEIAFEMFLCTSLVPTRIFHILNLV
jgi:hypothetical protein